MKTKSINQVKKEHPDHLEVGNDAESKPIHWVLTFIQLEDIIVTIFVSVGDHVYTFSGLACI